MWPARCVWYWHSSSYNRTDGPSHPLCIIQGSSHGVRTNWQGKDWVNAFFKVLLWFCIAIYNTSSHEVIQMILPSPCAFYVYQFRHTNAPRYASTCICLEGTRNGKTTGDKKVLKAWTFACSLFQLKCYSMVEIVNLLQLILASRVASICCLYCLVNEPFDYLCWISQLVDYSYYSTYYLIEITYFIFQT